MGRCGQGKERCVAVGGQCGRSSCPLQGACKCPSAMGVSKADPQALGKKPTHSCTCESNEVLCPVKVAWKLRGAALRHSPDTRSLGCGRCGSTRKNGEQERSKSPPAWQELTPESRGTCVGSRGAQAVAVAGVDLWLIQAFCRWSSGAVLEFVRDCQLSAAVEVSAQVAKGVHIMEVRESMHQQVEDTMACEHVVSCEEQVAAESTPA